MVVLPAIEQALLERSASTVRGVEVREGDTALDSHGTASHRDLQFMKTSGEVEPRGRLT
jgi:hypothetical protein